jgi:hypothetical protein
LEKAGQWRRGEMLESLPREFVSKTDFIGR